MYTILYLISITIATILTSLNIITPRENLGIQILIIVIYIILIYKKKDEGNHRPGEYSTYTQVIFDLSMGETIILQANNYIGGMKLVDNEIVIRFENEDYSYYKKVTDEMPLEDILKKTKKIFNIRFFKNNSICHVELIRNEK